MSNKTPPLEVLLRGPAATAAWFAEQDAAAKRKVDAFVINQTEIMRACHIDPSVAGAKITAESLSLALGACIQVAAVIAFAAKGGMRGPARDAVNEVVDVCFDIIDTGEEKSAEFRKAVDALREGARGT